MPYPTRTPLPRLRTEKELARWSEQLISTLEKQQRDFRFSAGTLTLPAGVTNNFDTKGNLLVRITGPGGPFTITGIAGGEPGSLVILHNDSGQDLTIADESALSGAANRIQTMQGADVTSIGNCTFTFVYSMNNRWVMTAART